MALATADRIEDATGLAAAKARRATGFATDAARRVRRRLGRARYEELVNMTAGTDDERQALVRAECLLCLWLAAPMMSLSFNEGGGITNSPRGTGENVENISQKNLARFRDSLREQVDDLLGDLAVSDGEPGEDEPQEGNALYHI